MTPILSVRRFSRSTMWKFLSGLTVALMFGQPLVAQIQPACLLPMDPVPDLSQFGRPGGQAGVFFPDADFYYLHSSTHLQGRRASEKWTGGLIYRPPIATGFGGFTSLVIVDNGDNAALACVEIDYFDELGSNVGTTGPHTISADGFHAEAATPLAAANGVGSALIRVVACADGSVNQGIVGASLLHTRDLFDVHDPDVFDPGMASMQQLQKVQNRDDLWWGPLPLTKTSATDFFNGNAPFFTIVNPNDTATTVQIDFFIHDRATGQASGPWSWRTVTLRPKGSIIEFSGPHLANLGTTPLGLWNAWISAYTSGANVDWDILINARSLDGVNLLGDGVMTDVFGNGLLSANPNDIPHPDVDPLDNLRLGKKFRMASTMLFNEPDWRLVAPDNSIDAGSPNQRPLVRFLGGVANVGPNDVDTRFEYFSRNGAPISTGSITLATGQTVRIEPGAPGYPADRPFGWMRVTGCNPSDRLIGWSGHEILDTPPQEPHFHKVYAQALEGINLAEPGPGFDITDPNLGDLTRKVAPLDRVWTGLPWPSYTTFVNDSVSNIGPYRFQFFDAAGLNCTIAGLIYAGLPFSWTSTTYEDPLISALCPGQINLMGTVDHTDGRIEGIDVIGDPLEEYGFPDFAGPWNPRKRLPRFPGS